MRVHKRFCVYGYIYVRLYVCIVYVRDRDECMWQGVGGWVGVSVGSGDSSVVRASDS